MKNQSINAKEKIVLSPAKVRQQILLQSKRANVGHIGSALSIVELLVSLYQDILVIPDIHSQNRDRFILSKGHAALALYSVLHLMNWLSLETLNSYHESGSLLGTHPEHALPGIDFSTGSLGQGLSYGVGAALAARLQGSSRSCFVIMSDAECNEGSIWEAAMFAAHHKLANLVVLIDDNKQQALGYTKDVLNIQSLQDRWQSFGWEAVLVNGHDLKGLSRVMTQFNMEVGPPHVIIAQTTFGKGVSFMENTIDWHYLPMSDTQFALAIAEIETQL